jgi:hypothetical protein
LLKGIIALLSMEKRCPGKGAQILTRHRVVCWLAPAQQLGAMPA